jgi:hypothetical protein
LVAAPGPSSLTLEIFRAVDENTAQYLFVIDTSGRAA